MNENLDPTTKGYNPEELDLEKKLRPLSFDDFAGQDQVLENLKVFVAAANQRGEALDHTLFHGPPGLGKTTLANILANELEVGIKITSGPVLDKPGDLAGLLTNLDERDVLFIDEIHRLSPIVEEYLYSAMEDFKIDIMIESGPNARTVQINLNPFTLIGATTRSGLLTAPMRARFGISSRLQYYTTELLTTIVERSASILKMPIGLDAAIEIAGRSRGTPRIANALLRRVRDFAQIKGNGTIDLEIARYALKALNVDAHATTNHCGSCTACIDACPTQAIVAPYIVDGSKCISYYTIELKENIPYEMKGKFDEWMFGCDTCQDVCPWNRFSKPHSEPLFSPNSDLLSYSKKDWIEITEETFRTVFKNSPIKRAKFDGLKRNVKFLE